MRAFARQLCHGAIAIAVVLLSAIAASAQQPVSIYGLTIPERVGGLTRGQTNDYESKSPGLGYSLRFSWRPNSFVDAYIYDMQLKSIPDSLESAVMREHFIGVKEDVYELERRGGYANVRAQGEFTVGRSGGRFVCATFSYLRGEKRDMDVDSYLCLTSWNNKFVKLRMTALKGVMSRADAESFAEAWISLLAQPR
jgi:hypothetical protein